MDENNLATASDIAVFYLGDGMWHSFPHPYPTLCRSQSADHSTLLHKSNRISFGNAEFYTPHPLEYHQVIEHILGSKRDNLQLKTA